MKKVFTLIIGLAFVLGASAQVFNTAKTLKQGTFALGIEPTILAKGGTDFALFGHVGYGIAKGIDIAAKASVLSGSNYYGADIEFAFMKNMSLSAGAHIWGDFGLDATFLGTYEIAKNVDLYGGLDFDLNLGGNIYANFWIPVGVEVQISKEMNFIFESSIGINSSATHMFGGGINVYF